LSSHFPWCKMLPKLITPINFQRPLHWEAPQFQNISFLRFRRELWSAFCCTCSMPTHFILSFFLIFWIECNWRPPLSYTSVRALDEIALGLQCKICHFTFPVLLSMWSGPDGRNMLCTKNKLWELDVCFCQKRSEKIKETSWFSGTVHRKCPIFLPDWLTTKKSSMSDPMKYKSPNRCASLFIICPLLSTQCQPFLDFRPDRPHHLSASHLSPPLERAKQSSDCTLPPSLKPF
jgi:hypothetical protein